MPVEEMPIACTLVGATLTTRLARIATMTRANLLSHRRAGQQLRLSYRPEAAEELREIVALERTCCAVLDFDVQENDTGVVLTITAPPHAEESAEGLFSQFTPGPKQQPSMTGCGCSSELVDLIDHPRRPCIEVRDVAAARLSEVRERIAELQALESSLGAFVESCESSCAGGAVVDCTVLEDLTQPGRGSPCCASRRPIRRAVRSPTA